MYKLSQAKHCFWPQVHIYSSPDNYIYNICAHTKVANTRKSYSPNSLKQSYYSQSPSMPLSKPLLDHCLPPNKTVWGSENALNRSHTKNLTCREASMEQVPIFFSSKGPLLSNSFRPKPIVLCVRQSDQNLAVARKVHRWVYHLQSQ